MVSCPAGNPGRPRVPAEPAAERSRRVFVVYGRNRAARLAVFAFLRSIGLVPIEWSQALAATGKASPYVGEVLDAGLATAQAVVVLWTPDEIVSLRPEYADGEDDPEINPAFQARPNVIFEAGLALGRAPDRVVLVELGRVRHFSDVIGRNTIRLGNSVTSRQELAVRLRTAGCPVDLSGTDWHTAGDFTFPPPPQPKLYAVGLTARRSAPPHYRS
jgi:predicted nucleotide-binding protein